MSSRAAAVAWPRARLAEALLALARKAGLPAREAGTASEIGSGSLDGEVHAAASRLGLEAEGVEVRYADAASVLKGAGPAVIAAPGGEELWIVLGSRGARVVLLDPEWRRVRVPLEELRARLCAGVEAPVAAQIDELLVRAGLPPSRLRRARPALLREKLGGRPVGLGWLLRVPLGAPMRHLLSEAGAFRQLAQVLVAHAAEFALAILGWWLVGRAALEGRFEVGWLVAWALLLATAVPIRLAAVAAAAQLSIDAGAALKRRLLSGALHLEPEEVRHEGAGQLLGRVLESDAVEALVLSGGLTASVAALQLALVIPVLAAGAAPGSHLTLLAAWTAGAAFLVGREWRWRERWTRSRLKMTHDLVERMVGHRTRLAQEPRERWHEEEDVLLEDYVGVSTRADGAGAIASTVLPRGWLLLGLLGLAPAFVAGAATPGALAVSVGGVILAAQAWRQLAQGLSQVMGAAIAWKNVRPLFEAAERERGRLPPASLAARAEGPLEVHDVSFRYPSRPRQVLGRCSLKISPGERLLLEGPSGSGKTALASVLAGLRKADAGLVLLGGIDRATLGETAWRRRIACSPQFHENHVISGTLAFNVLLGRGWPPTTGDLKAAEEILRALGLGPLLERMPAGLQQTVGESGWQLSHGERSRVFIARGLLQEPDVLILDESFACLDPENLGQSLECVLKRAKALVVVAHP